MNLDIFFITIIIFTNTILKAVTFISILPILLVSVKKICPQKSVEVHVYVIYL